MEYVNEEEIEREDLHKDPETISSILNELDQPSRINVKFTGQGGQGIILMGFLFGKAAIFQGLNAVQTQKYGPENRGSAVESDVVISKQEIKFPLFDKIHILITMTQQMYDLYQFQVVKHGLIFLDDSFVHHYSPDPNTFAIPATRIAERELNNSMLGNMVLMGFIFQKLDGFIEKEKLIDAIRESVPDKYVEPNIKAFNLGYTFIPNENEKASEANNA